jgi:hypothetical protein
LAAHASLTADAPLTADAVPPAMEPEKAEARFLKQAERGVAWWRLQRRIAFALAAGLAMGGAYGIWALVQAEAAFGEAFAQALLWLALAVAAATWTLHCELMEGAAHHVAARRLAEGPPGSPT